jgi:hypothetical protein
MACLDLTASRDTAPAGGPAGPGGRPPSSGGQPPGRAGQLPGWALTWAAGGLGVAFIAAGAAMVPWLAVLAVWLPSSARAWHWSTAWVGLDALEGAGLFLTGWLHRRGDPRRCLAAMATAVLLTADAWFDVTTSAPGSGLATAVAMAVGAELPLAALCTGLALRWLAGAAPAARRTGHPASPGGGRRR